MPTFEAYSTQCLSKGFVEPSVPESVGSSTASLTLDSITLKIFLSLLSRMIITLGMAEPTDFQIIEVTIKFRSFYTFKSKI